MGLNYSFEFITQTYNLIKLMNAFSARLSKKDREKFGNFHDYEPEYEDSITDSWGDISNIKLGVKFPHINGEYESKNNYCFSLLPETDESIEQFFDENGGQPDKEDGKLPIGCAWTSLYVDDDHVLLQVSAATSNMSRLFENSKSIQLLCKDIAEEVGNTSVFLDKEDELYWWQIFPEIKKMIRPDPVLFSNYKETSIINVDAYVMEAERLAGIDIC